VNSARPTFTGLTTVAKRELHMSSILLYAILSTWGVLTTLVIAAQASAAHP
jgi:hypothetical protein